MRTIFRGKSRPPSQPPGQASSPNSPARQSQDRRKQIKEVALASLEILEATSSVVSEIGGIVGVPWLKPGLAALSEILRRIQEMRDTVEGVETLHGHIVSLSRVIINFSSFVPSQPLYEEMQRRLDRLSNKWVIIAAQAQGIKSHGVIKRILTSKADAKKLEGLVEQINNSIQEEIVLPGLLNIEAGVDHLRRDIGEVHHDVRGVASGVEIIRQEGEAAREDVGVIREDVEVVREDVGVIRRDMPVIGADIITIRGGVHNIEEDMEKIRAHIHESFMQTYAKRAHYKANKVRKACLEGTRMDLLEELWTWILATCAQTGESITYIVYWINGLAGTGKTTIAFSVAERCEAEGLLAASFFCARDDVECNKPDLVFVTISRQLCYYFPPLKEKVAEVLSQNPDVVHSDASTQFEKLILEPLEKLECDFPRGVVVIDALDECHGMDEDATSTIVSIIAKFVLRIAPFLILILTGRPERRITYLFDGSEDGTLKATTTPLLLHMVKLESVLDDIRRYFQKHFAQIRAYSRLPAVWPSSHDLSMIVDLSTGLFIWATTVIHFIGDPRVCDPEGQLQEVLNVQSTSQQAVQTPEEILDLLYKQISEAAVSKISDKLAGRLQPILGVIVLAQEPLSVATLAALTENKADSIRRTLEWLHSVLHIPDTDDEPIRIIHPTFAEYLLRSLPAKHRSFSIDAAAQHMCLFFRTLKIMDDLKPNIASFPTPSAFRSEVVGLDNIVKEKISAALSYSSRHWSAHLGHCGHTGHITTIPSSLDQFFRTRALTWLEACSLLDALDSSVAALQTAQRACRDYGAQFAPLAELISDCLRFTQAYYACIDVAPLQIYRSLLRLAPAASLVKQQYARELKQSLLIPRGVLPDWGPCIAAWSGHQGSSIFSVSFSADGVYFATGGEDGYIRIWRTVTRTSVKAIPAGDGNHRVAFSPDGTRVASAPNLRIWDVKTGDVVHTLEHDGAYEVACSADGTRLASGSREEIKLWDPLNGTCLGTIASVRAGYFNGMAISPDGTLIRGNTAENHAAICDISSKVPEAFDQENEGPVAAFSPDGLHVASRASETVTIWTLKDKLLVRTIDASSYVNSVAFSHSSTQIGCGCSDGRVRIWMVASDEPPRVFAGHINAVNALAWSPDDTQVISVSDDGTIRVWDLTRHRSNTTLAASPPSSLPPLPGAPCYAVLRTPNTTALFSLPAPIQPSTAASDVAEDAPSITLHGDMADAWDAILRGDRASGNFAASRDWAFLTGRLHTCTDEYWSMAASDRSLVAYTVPGYSGKVRIYDCRTGDHLPMTSSSGLMPPALAFTPDHTHLAIVHCGSRSLGVWDVTSQDGNPIKDLILDSSPTAFAYSHNGSLLVARMENGDVYIYDATSGQSVKHLHGSRGKVTQIAFSADNRHVIAQAHPWLIIWDATTGEQILEFTLTHDHLLYSFDFATDDTGIIILDSKGGTTKVTLWNPGERKWPAYTVTEDGWLYAKSPGKAQRLCWLPPEWRAVFPLGGSRLCAPDTEQKRTVVFDVSRIPEYAEMWGAESEGALT